MEKIEQHKIKHIWRQNKIVQKETKDLTKIKKEKNQQKTQTHTNTILATIQRRFLQLSSIILP